MIPLSIEDWNLQKEPDDDMSELLDRIQGYVRNVGEQNEVGFSASNFRDICIESDSELHRLFQKEPHGLVELKRCVRENNN